MVQQKAAADFNHKDVDWDFLPKRSGFSPEVSLQYSLGWDAVKQMYRDWI